MAKAPPTGGQLAGVVCPVFASLIARYHERADDARRLTRRLQREMASLWVFLCEHGVDATNNRAERSLRFAVLWRKSCPGYRQCQRQSVGRAEFVGFDKRVANWANRPFMSWSMPSPAPLRTSARTSPGSTNSPHSLQTLCNAYVMIMP